MNGRIWTAMGMASLLVAVVAAAAPSRSERKKRPRSPVRAVEAVQPKPERPALTPEEARVAVAVLGDAYDLLLEEIHATYHTKPSVPVAATVLRKVQTKMAQLGWPQSRFLAVNAIVMHPDHVARDNFEKEAVQVLRKGDRQVEAVLDGQLRAARVVPLGGECSSCHWSQGNQSARAAIRWKIPLRGEGRAD